MKMINPYKMQKKTFIKAFRSDCYRGAHREFEHLNVIKINLMSPTICSYIV